MLSSALQQYLAKLMGIIMSGDGYFRHKVIMEIGTKKGTDKDKQIKRFKDDREFLAYLLEQEKIDIQISSAPGALELKVK